MSNFVNARPRVVGVLVYFSVATIISGAFRPQFFDFYNTDAIPFLAAFALGALAIGLGPTIAALIAGALFGPKDDRVTLLGTWPLGALLSLALAPAIMAGFGYPNDAGVNAHLYGAALGSIIAIYAVLEEIGWRGYANDALKPWGFWARAIVTGALWWAWHLWFLDGSIETGLSLTPDWQQMGILLVALIGASALFTSVVDQTRSIFLAGAFHAVGNIAMFAGSLDDLANSTRWIMAGIMIVLLMGIHRVWMRRQDR